MLSAQKKYVCSCGTCCTGCLSCLSSNCGMPTMWTVAKEAPRITKVLTRFAEGHLNGSRHTNHDYKARGIKVITTHTHHCTTARLQRALGVTSISQIEKGATRVPLTRSTRYKYRPARRSLSTSSTLNHWACLVLSSWIFGSKEPQL